MAFSEQHVVFTLWYCKALNVRFEQYIAVAGWGRTVGGGSAADTLQQAMLPVAEHSTCSRVNGGLVPVDEKSMVCAGGQGKGGCQVLKFIQIVNLKFNM